MTTEPWGRVDEDGTVYVRTATGERTVGSWQAGAPDEALAYFRRKYDALVTEIDLLEQRIKTTDLAAAQAEHTIARLRESVTEAHAVGDLDGLAKRLDGLTGLLGERRAELKVVRDQARVQAREVKERIVGEAERIAAEETHWKNGGERLRQLVEEWKAAERVDRPTETALWKRLSSARNSFTKRRKAYFSNLEVEREQARSEKERLVTEAETMSGSTDWAQTAAAYRDLMRQWKLAGRASRDAEEDLWARFKGAQDTFFAARSAIFAERARSRSAGRPSVWSPATPANALRAGYARSKKPSAAPRTPSGAAPTPRPGPGRRRRSGSCAPRSSSWRSGWTRHRTPDATRTSRTRRRP